MSSGSSEMLVYTIQEFHIPGFADKVAPIFLF